MQMHVKFICCYSYDFEGMKGIACKCFDTDKKKIIKVKTKHLLDYEFGDDVLVNVVPNGNYLEYQISE